LSFALSEKMDWRTILNLTLLGTSILLGPHLLIAQNTTPRNYDWDEVRPRIQLTSDEESQPSLILKHYIGHEYTYDDQSQDLIFYETVHKIIRVNSDDAIQSNNKVYISTENVLDLIQLKARSLNSNGEMVLSDRSNIKELKEEGTTFKIFAVEGVEKGSEIEFVYTKKMQPRYFGREYIQSKTPAKTVRFQLVSPSNLIFSLKGYNGLVAPPDTIIDGKRYWDKEIENIPELRKEAYSFFDAKRMRLEYKLSYNTLQGNNRLLTWSDASSRIYSNIYGTLKEEEKEIQKLVKSLKLKGLSEPEKIVLIENFIKSNFALQDGHTADFENLEAIVRNKYASKRGIVRLFTALFKQAGIGHELVMTSDRTKVKFDPDFDSWNYLVHYVFYMTQSDKFLSPVDPEYRYGMIPYNLTHNYGLFIKEVSIGEFESGVGEIKYIPALDYLKNYDNMRIEVGFSDDMSKSILGIKRELGGYSAVYIQPYYSFLPKDKQREVGESYIKLSASDAQFSTLEVQNGESNLSPLEAPFIIMSKLESASLIERAGNKFLFKLGDVIGPQTELYQEYERVLGVENDFNRLYDRNIKIRIPEGYRVKNLDDIKLDVSHQKDGETVFLFKSDYQINGNVVDVQIDEYYKVIEREVEFFEEFRKVINAAADFNKVTLVLERK